MAVLKKIFLALVVVVALAVIVGFFLPSNVHVERTTVIDAPACTVYSQVTSYPRFSEWSPWADRDPEAVYTYEGAEEGVGARMTWASDDPNVGSGSQEIVLAEPWSRVESALDFGDQGTADAFFAFGETGEGSTHVTWGFDTHFGMNLVGRYMGLFLDRWVGADYAEGLVNLKALAEGLPGADWCDLGIEGVEMPATTYAYAEGRTSHDPEEIHAAMAAAYGQVTKALQRAKMQPIGPALTVGTEWDEENEVYAFRAGFPVAAAPETAPEGTDVRFGQLGGRAVVLLHVGPYDGLAGAHEALGAYLAAHGLEMAGYPWEEYLNNPMEAAEEELETRVVYPVG